MAARLIEGRSPGAAAGDRQMQRIFVDPALQETFEAQGFAVVRLLSGAEAASLLDGLEALRRDAPPVELPPDEALVKSFFHTDADYRTGVDALVREALSAPFRTVVAGYRLAACGQFIKRPRAKEMGLHRDWTILRDPGLPALNIWCPLVEVGRSNGTLALLPGSHKLPNIETPGVEPFYAGYGEALKRGGVTFDLSAGEAVLFDNRILHWSTANATDRERPVLRAVSLPQSERIVFYRVEAESGGARFEIVDIEEDGALSATPRETEHGTIARKSLGFVANDNRSISLRECERLLGLEPREAAGGGRLGGLIRRVGALLSR